MMEKRDKEIYFLFNMRLERSQGHKNPPVTRISLSILHSNVNSLKP